VKSFTVLIDVVLGFLTTLYNRLFDSDVLLMLVGVFIFSFLCLVGSATFAAGTFLRGTAALLPVMLLGRLLFGSGNGSLTSQFCTLFAGLSHFVLTSILKFVNIVYYGN